MQCQKCKKTILKDFGGLCQDCRLAEPEFSAMTIAEIVEFCDRDQELFEKIFFDQFGIKIKVGELK